jgi:hypothetical protein
MVWVRAVGVVLTESEGGKKRGRERVTDVEGVVEVAAAEEEDDDEPVKVIPVLKSPPRRPAYKQMVQIWIDPLG